MTANIIETIQGKGVTGRSTVAALIALGIALGAVGVIFGEIVLRDAPDKVSQTLDRCKSAADPTGNEPLNDGRVLRITDCMAANGYVFNGSKARSECFAQHPIQVQIKHVLSSCYERPTIWSRMSST